MSTEASIAAEDFERKMRRGGAIALQEMSRFFVGTDPVHRAVKNWHQARRARRSLRRLRRNGRSTLTDSLPRATIDVDSSSMADGLKAVHDSLEGLGYVPPFAGSKNLRDTETGVRIEFLVTGQFPGDGKPKSVAFPDPAQASVDIDGVRFLGLSNLVELKLASGLTGGVARLVFSRMWSR